MLTDWKHLRQGKVMQLQTWKIVLGLVKEADSQLVNKGHSTCTVCISYISRSYYSERHHMVNMCMTGITL